MSGQKPAQLTTDDAELLDSAGFVEDPAAYAEAALTLDSYMARLLSTAFTGARVARGLGWSASSVRQSGYARTLWAIRDDADWVYPAVQFDIDTALKQIPGLDKVLPALPEDLHPASVEGFLLTPQMDLWLEGHPYSVRDWLLAGGDVGSVMRLVKVAEWMRS